MDLYTKDNVPWFLKVLNMIYLKKFMPITWKQLGIPEWQKKCCFDCICQRTLPTCATLAPNVQNFKTQHQNSQWDCYLLLSLPWEIMSQDLFEFENNDYLVTVCHFSDWIGVDHLPETLATTVINCTKAHFAHHDKPDICHMGNGPQYISNKLKMLSRTYAFQHTWSAPYYPKGNRRAEAAIKVAKNTLKWSNYFYSALLNYRNTSQQGHSYCPAQRMMNCRTRTLLPTKAALLPLPIDVNNIKQQIINKRIAAKLIYDWKAGPVHSNPAIAGLSLKKTPHVWLLHAKTTYIVMACNSKLHAMILWYVISVKLNMVKKISGLKMMTLDHGKI